MNSSVKIVSSNFLSSGDIGIYANAILLILRILVELFSFLFYICTPLRMVSFHARTDYIFNTSWDFTINNLACLDCQVKTCFSWRASWDPHTFICKSLCTVTMKDDLILWLIRNSISRTYNDRLIRVFFIDTKCFKCFHVQCKQSLAA